MRSEDEMARGRGGATEREKAARAELSASTQGMEDCGKARKGRYVMGCRCDACKAARSAYERSRRRRKAAEAFGKPTTFVDAEPVRKRLLDLREEGYTVKEIERLSGVGHTQQYQITVRHWRTGKPVAKVRRETKDAIFGIPRGRRSLTKGQRVDASWMSGWLAEYRDAGMSVAEMSRTTGIDRQVLDSLLNGRRERCEARTLHAFVVAKPALDRVMEARKEAERGWSRRA